MLLELNANLYVHIVKIFLYTLKKTMTYQKAQKNQSKARRYMEIQAKVAPRQGSE